MKKLFTVLIASFLCLGLVACDTSSNQDITSDNTHTPSKVDHSRHTQRTRTFYTSMNGAVRWAINNGYHVIDVREYRDDNYDKYYILTFCD